MHLRKMGSYPVFWKTIQIAAGLSLDTTVGRIFFKCWKQKNRLSTQKPTLNKNMLSSREKNRFRDEGMLKRIVNRHSLKEIVLTKEGTVPYEENKTKPLVNTLSLSLRLTTKTERVTYGKYWKHDVLLVGEGLAPLLGGRTSLVEVHTNLTSSSCHSVSWSPDMKGWPGWGMPLLSGTPPSPAATMDWIHEPISMNGSFFP